MGNPKNKSATGKQKKGIPFFLLSLQTFQLLPADQRPKIFRSLVFATLFAGLDVLSLVVIFPLLQVLLGNGKSPSNSFLLRFNQSIESLHWAMPIALIVCLFFFKNLFGLRQIHRQSILLDRLYIRFAEQIYRGFYQQSWGGFTQTNSSEAFRKIKNTAYEFTHTVLYSYFTLVPELIICFLMVGLISLINYKILFVLAVLFLPILLLFLVFRKKVIQKIDTSFRELTPQTSIVLLQGIDAFAEAKVYAKEDYFIEHFIAFSRKTIHQLSRFKTWITFPSRLVETMGVLCFAGLIVYGKAFPDAEQSVALFFVMLSVAIYRIIPAMNRILNCVSQIQAYTFAVYELQEALVNDNLAKVVREEIGFEEKIELRSILFRYENASRPILENLSVEINKGDLVVLEGASGSGKTTLVHLLAGLLSDYSGQIKIDNTSLTPSRVLGWQQKIGIVQQAPVILQDTLLKNIVFGVTENNISADRLNDAIQNSGLSEFVDSLTLKLQTSVGENGLQLSGGQRQRLALARALYRNPQILLLDEVTNQLDEANKLLILTTLTRLVSTGKTVVLISHDPLAKKFANRILYMNEGRVMESSTSQ